MIIKNTKVWVIMSKDKKFIAKGTPRNRELVKTNDMKDKKRYLTYSSRKRAELGFKNDGFYGCGMMKDYEYGKPLENFLEAVECNMVLKAIF